MPWADLGARTLGLLVYPGLLALAVVGLLAEAGAAWALVPERGGPLPAARSVLAGLLPERGARGLPPLAGIAAVLALLAASQVAAPLSPVPAPERNLLVAGLALVATGWLTWAWGWTRPQIDPALLLLVQACWLVALLAPAVVAENLRPQVLGAVVVRQLLPLKLAATLLYALCLPVLLQLIHEAAPQGLPGAAGRGRKSLEQAGFSGVRVLLWLPYCALFSSLFFAPGADDPIGLLRFAGTTAGAAAIAIALAANLTRRPAATTRSLYLRLVAPFAAFTLLVAILTALLS